MAPYSIELFSDEKGLLDGPTGIIMGPDSNMWFTSLMSNAIGRLDTTTHKITLFHDCSQQMIMPANIYPDSQSKMWFTCTGSNHIGQINVFAENPQESIKLLSHPQILNPVAIKRSSNGNLWVSSRKSNTLCYFNPQSLSPKDTISIISDKKLVSPAAIFISEEDKLFFTNNDKNNSGIGYIDCASKAPADSLIIQSFIDNNAQLRAWAQDSQGKLWLTCQAPDMLVYFIAETFVDTPQYHIVTHSQISKPDGIYLGEDGYLYFVNTGLPSIGRIDPHSNNPGKTLQFFHHEQIKGLFDIKPGPNSTMWFTDKKGNAIGKLNLS